MSYPWRPRPSEGLTPSGAIGVFTVGNARTRARLRGSGWGAGKRKAGPLLGGGSQRAPGLTMIRLYYRAGPEHIPQMSDFFAETKKYATRRPPPNSRRVAHQPRLLSAGTPVSAR